MINTTTEHLASFPGHVGVAWDQSYKVGGMVGVKVGIISLQMS